MEQFSNLNGDKTKLTVLKAVELPAGVPHLGAGLANVDGDALAHNEVVG